MGASPNNSIAGGGFEFDHLVAAGFAFMGHSAHDDGADVDFDHFIADVTRYARLRQQFQVFLGPYRARHRAVDHHVADVDLAFDLGHFGQDQRAGLVADRLDIALDHA